jgi:hypothetical protein
MLLEQHGREKMFVLRDDDLAHITLGIIYSKATPKDSEDIGEIPKLL